MGSIVRITVECCLEVGRPLLSFELSQELGNHICELSGRPLPDNIKQKHTKKNHLKDHQVYPTEVQLDTTEKSGRPFVPTVIASPNKRNQEQMQECQVDLSEFFKQCLWVEEGRWE